VINVLLCGGSGTRLWPLSRAMLPKQFVRLFSGKSLFQNTVLRNKTLCKQSIIVSNIQQYFLAIDQLEQINKNTVQFLLEPVGRNTAPAIALACMALAKDDLVLVTTSDHLIKDQKAYEKVVLEAKELAKQGYLVTFGIKPSYAETGFGYIEADNYEVLSFKEKPTREKAESYIKQGNYYWNSGMFCFKAEVFLEELQKYSPKIYKTCKEAFSNAEKVDKSEIKIGLDFMQKIPENSIDYAVMEKSQKVKIVACDMGWSDLGSYDSLYEEFKNKQQSNVVLLREEDSPKPICIDAKNNLVVVKNRQIALIDVDELLVVDTSDAILISKKGSSQKVKQVVSELKGINSELTEIHRLAHRPWGTYEVLQDSEKYKVKKIVVKPNSKLSLQKHFHRNEHWIVVSGTATVTIDQEVFLVRPNESTYIKMGQLHRLENKGKIDLVMIEVQVGEYTGEDDIVRIEDVYGR
jgi:mannose-1-phosphate guanylyltransferase